MCENDPACCYCLERLWPGARLFRDVHDVTAESVKDLGPIDIISGGFPCQDISIAGKGAGLGTEKNKTRSGLWFEMLRVIDEICPRWVLAENVPTLRVRGADQVLAGLEKLGYACWPLVVGADDVGAPHRRKRVWIVGRLEYAKGSGCVPDNDDIRPGGQIQAKADELCDGELGPMHGTGESAGGSGGGELADTASQRKRESNDTECPKSRIRDAWQDPGRGGRWPARPGEPQHEWEAPRLVEFGLGDAVDGIPRRVRSRANKALLRMVGNAWCYPVALMLFRGIVELDRREMGC